MILRIEPSDLLRWLATNQCPSAAHGAISGTLVVVERSLAPSA